MRALARLIAVPTLLGLLALPAGAAEDCPPSDLERFTAEAMVADADLRLSAGEALAACARFALAQFRNTGEIEERVLAQVAALAGRKSYATYAADEIPKASPELVLLLGSAFRPFYPHLRALPEDENSAVMRTIVFHLMEQGAPAATGSVPRPPAASPPPTGDRP